LTVALVYIFCYIADCLTSDMIIESYENEK